MILVETSVFTRQVTALLNDDEYREFQTRLAANPALGPLIKGGGGIRKVRIALGSRGKRGGARVIYYLGRPERHAASDFRLPKECRVGPDTQTDRKACQSRERGIRK